MFSGHRSVVWPSVDPVSVIHQHSAYAGFSPAFVNKYFVMAVQ